MRKVPVADSKSKKPKKVVVKEKLKKPVAPVDLACDIKEDHIILGIDPGTARMGYAIVKVGKKHKPILVDTSVILTPQELEMPKRLKILYTELHKVVDRFCPHHMVIEQLFFNSNAKTAINVGQARGVAMLVAADQGVSVYEHTALEAKFVLTGYGRADKKQMQQAVKEWLALSEIIKSDDANDAVAMALCFLKKRAK